MRFSITSEDSAIVLLVVAAMYLRDPAPVEVSAGQTFGTFLASVGQSLLNVARLPHVWMASAFGALCFGVMLGLGVVWGPKLLMVRGHEAGTANVAASFLWHMLAFSTAGDVVELKYIGTSAAIVNGIMFIVGGIMISRPGVRIGLGIEEGVAPASLEMAQFAGRPLLIGVSLHARDLSTQARYVSIDGPRMLGRVSHGERHVRASRWSLKRGGASIF